MSALKRTHASKPRNDYFSKLKSPKWQKVRLKVFERFDWLCSTCSDTDQPLTVHHGFYRYGVEPWDLPGETLWCMCLPCHEMYQRELLELKLEIGKLYPQEYYNVLQMIRTMHDVPTVILKVK